jgi:hypothetical protein
LEEEEKLDLLKEEKRLDLLKEEKRDLVLEVKRRGIEKERLYFSESPNLHKRRKN